MSFSFRNIFSPDEESAEGNATGMPATGVPATGMPVAGGARTTFDPLHSEAAETGRYFQSFLLGELIAFIPTAISAQSGIPMEKEVEIPMPGDGSRDVKLSTLYQMCPELFAAEITPLNDSMVTLPPKLGAMPPLAGVTPEIASGHSLRKPPPGFSQDLGKISGASDEGNPFFAPAQKPDPSAEPLKKSDMKEEQPRPGEKEVSQWSIGPVGGREPLATPGSSPQNLPKGNAFSSPGPALQSAQGMAPAPGFTGGFAAFDPKAFSGNFGEGGEATKNAETPSQSEASFSGNPFESEQGFTTLFSKQAEKDLEIPFPTGTTPEDVADEPQGVWGAMFSGGGQTLKNQGFEKEEPAFAPPSFESIGNLLKQGAKGYETPAAATFKEPAKEVSVAEFSTVSVPHGKLSAPVFAAFPSAPPLVKPSGVEPATNGLQVSWSVEPKSAPLQTPIAETGAVPAPSGFSSFGLAPLSGGDVFETGLPGPGGSAEPPEVSFARVNEAPGASVPAAKPLAASVPDSGIELRDLELRAIFSLSEPFTLEMVSRFVIGLPGILSCSLTTPRKLIQASRGDDSPMGNEAGEMISTLRSLAKLTGLPEARTFTLHTDRGMVSLFLEGDCCLTVHHDAPTFGPGVREKLILVARSLFKLEE